MKFNVPAAPCLTHGDLRWDLQAALRFPGVVSRTSASGPEVWMGPSLMMLVQAEVRTSLLCLVSNDGMCTRDQEKVPRLLSTLEKQTTK